MRAPLLCSLRSTCATFYILSFSYKVQQLSVCMYLLVARCVLLRGASLAQHTSPRAALVLLQRNLLLVPSLRHDGC